MAPIGDDTLKDPVPFARSHVETTSSGAFDAPTAEAPTRREAPRMTSVLDEPPKGRFAVFKQHAREFLHRHERKIWWLHTCYALSLGAFVATFAQKGFDHARFLTLSLGFVWILVVFFFRFFGTGAQQDFITAFPGARRRFFVMTYLMKNLFQGMLFFLLPLYWKSGSADARTITIFYLLGACAILSTLDLVFDRVLLRYKLVASLFFGVTLFGCMNVAIPALLPSVPTIAVLLVSGGLAISTFFLFHIPFVWLRRPVVAGALASLVGIGVLSFYVGRRAFPAVPMYIKAGGVGPAIAADGSLEYEVKTVKSMALADLYAVTDVAVVDRGEHLSHVWRHDGVTVDHTDVATIAAPTEPHLVRVASHLDPAHLKDAPAGRYTVDVVTDAGQIVGRVSFDVRP